MTTMNPKAHLHQLAPTFRCPRLYTILALLLFLLFACASAVSGAPGGRGHGRGQQQKANTQAINEVKKQFKEGGLNGAERKFLVLLHQMAGRGFKVAELLAETDGFLNLLLRGIVDGGIDTADEVERIAELLRTYAADGTVDPNELVLLELSAVLLARDIPWAPSARSLIALLEQLAASGVDLEALLADPNLLIQSLISFLGDNPGERVPQELFDLLAQLVADGVLDENDLALLGLSAAMINIEAGQSVGNSSAVVILRKLVAAGIDLKTLIANRSTPVVQTLLVFVIENRGVPVPEQVCNLIDALAEDGTLDANDLFIINITLLFMGAEGGASAGTGSASFVLRKLADAGLDLVALLRDTKNTVLQSLIDFVLSNPGVQVPQELCDLIDALAADGTLDANDLFTLSLFASVMSANGGVTSQSLVLVEIILLLQEAGIDVAELIREDPDGFFVQSFFALLNDDIPLEDINEIAVLLMDFLMDGMLDLIEKAILLSLVEAAVG